MAAYGRLDVFFPDGMSKSYLLVDDNISIGRSTGNTIALETETISRYHMTITRQNGETYITDLDSQNGTFVDGKKIKENVPSVLRGGEEILIGELNIIYLDLDENPTRPVPIAEETPPRIELAQAAFRIDVEPPDIPISPGAHTSATLNITNTGEAETRYTVEVAGVPKEWVRIDRSELQVRPNETDDVIISFKPLRRPDSAPGDYRPQVTVAVKDDPTQTLTADVPLRILPYSGFGVALETKQIKSGERVRLHLHNQGSATLPITVSGRDPQAATPTNGALRFTFPPMPLMIAAGQRLVVDGQVAIRSRRMTGEPERHPFDLLIRNGDASGFLIATRGYMIDQPALPRWAVFAIGGLALAGLALLILALLVLLIPPPAPVIETFAPSDPRVQAGQPLTVNWTTQNSDSVTLFVNDTEIASYDAQTTSAQIDTTGYDGDLMLNLIASGSRATAVATAQAFVFTPLSIETFTAEPQPVVRFIPQVITLMWNAPGASTMDLQGAPGLESLSEGGESGAINIPLLLDETVPSITLVALAQNELGETAQTTLNLQVIDPVCAPSADILVYQYPNATAQVISTILVSDNTPVIVDGQNPEGEWLRVRLSGDTDGWVHQASLLCAGSFDPADLPVYESIMPPTATFTPSPTATLTLTPTLTFTATATFTLTASATPTPSLTNTASRTATPRPTRTTASTLPSTPMPNAPSSTDKTAEATPMETLEPSSTDKTAEATPVVIIEPGQPMTPTPSRTPRP